MTVLFSPAFSVQSPGLICQFIKLRTQEPLTPAKQPNCGKGLPARSRTPNRPPTVRLPWSSHFGTALRTVAPAELATYFERCTDGTFASLARTRLDAAMSPPSVASSPAEVVPDPLDLAFSESVEDSERREELEAYLEQQPNGHFAGLDRARLASSEGT